MIDAAELCRNAHESQAWREAAEATFTRLSDYIGMLNADDTLYATRSIVAEPRRTPARYAMLAMLCYATLRCADHTDRPNHALGTLYWIRSWQSQRCLAR